MLKTFSKIVLFISLVNASLIKGKITTKDGKALGNANIVSLPSGEGAQSDDSGMFMLSILPLDRIIVVSHIGYIADTIQTLDIQDDITILLEEKNILMDSLRVESKKRGSKVYFSKKKLATNLDLDNPAIRGSIDIGDALFSNFPVSINETMAGSKNISIRGSGDDELVFLYDGIRINNLSSGKVDLSQFNTLGLNNLELISGNSDNSIYSSGAINIIPKINYDNQITFSQKIGSYDFGNFDIHTSIGNKNVSINAGLSKGNFSLGYDDPELNKIQRKHDKIILNTGLKNGLGKELKLMGFRNKKSTINGKTKDTLNNTMQNIIVKFDEKNNPLGRLTFYGFFQDQIGSQRSILQKNKNNDSNKGVGLSYESIFNNSKFKISTESNRIRSLWEIDNHNFKIRRGEQKITGSFEIFQSQKREGLKLQDLKFIFSNQIISSSSDSDSLVFFQNSDGPIRSSKFLVSMTNEQSKIKKMIFLNLSNSFRVPSIHEIVHNEIHIAQSGAGLSTEQKSISEIGVKINDSEPNTTRSMSAVFTAFKYDYTNKIKQLYIEDSFTQIPINYGDASIFGFDNYIKFNLNEGRITASAYLTNYFFSDEMAFQLKPNKMYRATVKLNSIIGNIKFTYRKESEKYLTSINRSGVQSRTEVSSFENFDLDISKQLPLKYTDISISFSGKNLNNQTQSLMGISLYDRRFVLSIGLLIK